MTKAAQIRNLCRDIQRQERSRAARIFDFIGLRVLSLLVLYLVFRMLLPQLWGAVVLALIGTAMVSIAAYMIQNTRLDRYTEKTSREFTDNLLLQKLIVMPREELYAWCSQLAWRTGGYRTVKEVAQGLIVERFSERILFGICRRHPKSQLTPQDALEFYHALGDTGTASGVLLSTAPLSDDCKAFLSRLDRDIALCGPERLLSLARRYGLLPADDVGPTGPGSHVRPLEGEGGLEHLPTSADLPQQVTARDVGPVDEHLAEVRLAGDLTDRADLDPGLAHRQEEEADALVLGNVPVGASQQEPVLGPRSVGRPHLLTSDDPAAGTVGLGPCLEPGEVRTGARLAV